MNTDLKEALVIVASIIIGGCILVCAVWWVKVSTPKTDPAAMPVMCPEHDNWMTVTECQELLQQEKYKLDK